MLTIENDSIFVTQGDTGTLYISPQNEDGTPYHLSVGEHIRFFVRLLPNRTPIIEKELYKEEQNDDGSFCISFSVSDMYEAKLYGAENTEICTFIGGGAYKPRFVVT